MAPDAPSTARGVPSLAIIAAVARNGIIGAGNALPWRLPEDLKRFRALTTGHAVIMGRRTWESLGRPLPGRQNIVVTRRAAWRADGVTATPSLGAARDRVDMPWPAFCIGGGELYAAALPQADLMYLTEIDRDFAGDACFPVFARDAWREVARTPGRAAEGFDYAFVTYARAGVEPAAPAAIHHPQEQ